MLAALEENVPQPALVTDAAGILALLIGALALIFWATQQRACARVFKVVPALVFCYFIPTTLTTLGVIPEHAEVYDWIKAFVLPASLLLLVLALDVPGILRLGPKALITFLAGTLGVMLGGPLALWICGPWLPDDAWRGMTALSGSWIGGGANFVALGDIADVSPSMLALMVIPDVLVANIWTGTLLYFAGRQERIDRRIGADTTALRTLQDRLVDFQQRTARTATLADIMIILGLAFMASWACDWAADELPEIRTPSAGTLISASTWKYLLVTTLGVALSFTKVRNLEGAGASRYGSVMLYLLVACIGASADFRAMVAAPQYVLMGVVWMLVHVTVIMSVGWLIRAPIFYIAVGSMANIGGAASAPVVAGAFHQALAPVGVLLAILGYVLGTYCGIICMRLLMWVAGATQV